MSAYVHCLYLHVVGSLRLTWWIQLRIVGQWRVLYMAKPHGLQPWYSLCLLFPTTGPRTVADCGPLSDPSNGDVSLGGTTEGEVANYSCEGGFVLVGAQSRTCQPDGQWSGTAPNCSKHSPRVHLAYSHTPTHFDSLTELGSWSSTLAKEALLM